MKELTGTWRLVRLALRRDRFKLSIAILAVALLMPMFVVGISEIFATEEEMYQGISFLAANPAMRLFGLPTGGEMGHLLMLRTYTMIAGIVALISTFTVVRHTRQNEELGRFELIGASVVGRHAGLVAALVVAVVANMVMTLLLWLGMLWGGLPVESSLLTALAIGGAGLAFSGMAAVFAQFTQTSRNANGFSSAGIGAAFLLAGVGSAMGTLQPNGVAVEPAWPTWLSPFGWGQMTQPFAQENWWVLIIFGTFFLFTVTLSVILSSKRDIGMGMLPARLGNPKAKSGLLSLMGLTWRLQRGVFLGWFTAITALAVIYGVVANDVEDLLAQAGGIAEVFIASTGSTEIMLAYLGSIVNILGITAIAYGVQSMLRVRSEEVRALEFLLSLKVSRVKWLLVQILFVLLSTTAILVTSGLVVAVTVALVGVEIEGMLGQLIAGALVQLPAIFLFTSVVVAVFALMPRWVTAVSWAVVLVSILLGPMFAALLNLPEEVANISPLSHTPSVPPVENIETLPLLVLTLISFMLFAIGIVAYRRRDLVDA